PTLSCSSLLNHSLPVLAPPSFPTRRSSDLGDLAVLAVQVADLPAAHADVAGGHVEVGADVVGEFGHERLAEAHDLLLALAVRVEIGSALGATEPEPGERVLEDLLEAEELERVLVDGLVEAQSALVRAQIRAELDAEAALDLDGPGVVDPRHAEGDDALGLDDPLEDPALHVLRVLLDDRRERLEYLVHGLPEEHLSGVTSHHTLESVVQCGVGV